jgi:hypothetical protein
MNLGFESQKADVGIGKPNISIGIPAFGII